MPTFADKLYQMLQNEKKDWIEPCNKNCSFCFLNYTDILSENYLFYGLPKREIGYLVKEIHHQVKKCNKGEVIALEGDNYNKLMIIVKGSVVGEMMDFEGKVLRIEKLSAPETVATAFLFGKSNTLPVTITATEETRLLLFPKEDLLEMMRKNGQVLENYLDIMSNRAQFLSKQLRLLGLSSIKGKIAHYLLEQSKFQNSNHIKIKHSHEELAGIFGVARPSVSRVLAELNRNGILKVKGKQVDILNRSELSGMLT